MTRLSGKRALMEQLIADGHTHIFGNPGTTEQPFQDILQEYPTLRFTLALHEAVAVSTADGYARATGRPSFVELHISPGLGNAIGMIYNAQQGCTPMVIYVGHSPTDTLFQEPHLSGDLVRMARPVTKWAYEVVHAADLPQALRRAHKVAMTPPMGPVVLSIPMNVMDQEAEVEIAPTSYLRSRMRPEEGAMREAAEQLLRAESPYLLVGQPVAVAGAQEEVGVVARLLGAPIYQLFASEPVVRQDEPLFSGAIPFLGGPAVARTLADADALLSVGAQLFRVVFPDPGNPLRLGTTVVHVDSAPWQIGKNLPNVLGVLADPRAAMQELIDELRRLQTPAQAERARARGEALAAKLRERREKQLAADRERWDAHPISVPRLMSEVVNALPPNALVTAESSTSSRVLERYLRPRPGDYFASRGGGLGAGMTTPIGAKLAHPDRPVVAVVSDGASMYTNTALWTAAHHRVNITYVVCNNAEYRILKENMGQYLGQGLQGRSFVELDLNDPPLRFDLLAQSMGVHGRRVERADDLAGALREAIAVDGPSLVDVAIESRPR